MIITKTTSSFYYTPNGGWKRGQYGNYRIKQKLIVDTIHSMISFSVKVIEDGSRYFEFKLQTERGSDQDLIEAAKVLRAVCIAHDLHQQCAEPEL